MDDVPDRIEPLIDITVRRLIEERPDIDPARAADLRSDLCRSLARSVGQGPPGRLVLESGWMVPNLDRFVEDYGWTLERRTQNRGRTEIVWRVDGDNLFHVVSSELCFVEYCTFSGPDAALLLSLASVRIPFLDVDDLRHAARSASTDDERCAVVWALGAGASEPGEFIEHFVRRLMSAGSARVRRAAVEAASLTGWPVFAPALRALAEQDADEEVRAASAWALGLRRSAMEGDVRSGGD